MTKNKRTRCWRGLTLGLGLLVGVGSPAAVGESINRLAVISPSTQFAASPSEASRALQASVAVPVRGRTHLGFRQHVERDEVGDWLGVSELFVQYSPIREVYGATPYLGLAFGSLYGVPQSWITTPSAGVRWWVASATFLATELGYVINDTGRWRYTLGIGIRF